MVAAFGFVEGVVGGVVCGGDGQGSAVLPFEVCGEVFGEAAVLAAGSVPETVWMTAARIFRMAWLLSDGLFSV